MADFIQFKVSVTPIEEIAQEAGLEVSKILASEVGVVLGGGGDSIDLADYSGTAVKQGYKDGAVEYLDAVHTAGGVALATRITTADNGDFFFIKNTGFKYSSGTTLGVVTTDCVMIVIHVVKHRGGDTGGYVNSADADEDHFYEIAWLKPGQAIVLPVGAANLSITQFGSNTDDLTNLNHQNQLAETSEIYVKTIQSAGAAALDGNAVEFLAVT